MASEPQLRKARSQARAACLELRTFEMASLDNPTLGATGDQIRTSSVGLLALYEPISDNLIELLPFEAASVLAGCATSAAAVMKRVAEAHEGLDATHLQREIAEIANRTVKDILPVLAYATVLSFRQDFDAAQLPARVETLMEKVEDTETRLDETSKASAKLLDETRSEHRDAREAVDAIRKMAASGSALKHANYFQQAESRHNVGAMVWLLGAAAIAGLLTWAVVWSFTIGYPKDAYALAQIVSSKVLLYLTILSFLYLAMRVSLAHRHNSIVNGHRMRALLTYEAMIAGSAHEDNREQMLNYAAACIFAPQPTGFSKDGPEAPSPQALLSLVASKTGASGG